ncbi:hypothetical protein Hanom_Chr12g01172761 [Helianthus anomalus]
MQAFSCLATLPASALVIACPATNPWSLSPTRRDTPVKSTHACLYSWWPAVLKLSLLLFTSPAHDFLFTVSNFGGFFYFFCPFN